MRRVLHFDCFSGISGDMTVAALLDLGVPESVFQTALGSLGLEGKLRVEKVSKSGFAATQVHIDAPHEHVHRHLSDIESIVEGGALTNGARAIAGRIFRTLAEAEAHAHGIPVERVHFHEVGAIDSIFDIVAAAVGIDWIGAEHITASPVPTGTGWIETQHGRLPVPPPAVARLLVGVPMAHCEIEAELTTPTGAAILVTVVDEFAKAPSMITELIGCGAGKRDLAQQPNILRLFLGSAAETASGDSTVDFLWQVETNLDDVSPEIVGYCFDRLFEAGALDVFACPIQMKKNRLGTMLGVLCADEKLAAIEAVLFRETGTFGVRRHRVERTTLHRRFVELPTPWGPVKAKVGNNRNAITISPEFEDCVRIARLHGVALLSVFRDAMRAYGIGDKELNP